MSLKAILTALVVTSCGAPAYAETQQEICAVVSQVGQEVATMRDVGIPPAVSVSILQSKGATKDVALGVVTAVYLTLKNHTPEEVGDVYLDLCLGQST